MQEVQIGEHLGDSGHNMIRFIVNSRKPGTDNGMMVPNFKRANYVGLRDRLGSTNWQDVLNNESTDAIWFKL